MHTQEDFIELANTWANIFLTWIPWAWKTYILNQWLETKKDKTVVKVAPTWVAAMQIWWSTIHSAFKLSWSNYDLIKKQDIRWDSVDILVIDEISMVCCNKFWYINKVLKQYSNKPFGWLQVIVVGDLAQLDPVYNLNNEYEKELYEKTIEEKWWIYFLLDDSYEEWNFQLVNLTESKRSNDPLLNSLLLRIRQWDKTAINEFRYEWYSAQFYNAAVHIFPYNKQVDDYNYERLLKLKWKQIVFNWVLRWDFNIDSVLAPMELKVKDEARIMVIKNLSNGLVNWDMWYVVNSSIEDWYITIYSDRLEQEFIITPEEWQNKKYDSNWNEEVVWTFTQYPIRLWYWLTAHKTQGLTLDKVIYHYNPRVSLKLSFVALSRVRTFDSIYLVRN